MEYTNNKYAEEFRIDEKKGRRYKESLLEMLQHEDAAGVEIIVEPQRDYYTQGTFYGQRNQIGLVRELWEDDGDIRGVLCVMHEMGHVFDIQRNYDGNIYSYCGKYDEENTRYEFRAWYFAAHIANAIGFTEWDMFFADVRHSLYGYARNEFPMGIALSYLDVCVTNIADSLGIPVEVEGNAS